MRLLTSLILVPHDAAMDQNDGDALTKSYKRELLTLVEVWWQRDNDPAALLAALVEVAVEGCLVIAGKAVAIDMLKTTLDRVRAVRSTAR